MASSAYHAAPQSLRARIVELKTPTADRLTFSVETRVFKRRDTLINDWASTRSMSILLPGFERDQIIESGEGQNADS
jgi:hypothetical protein